MNVKQIRNLVCTHTAAKRIISIILSFAMLLTLTAGIDFSVYADVSGDFEYIVLADSDEKSIRITAYSGKENNLAVPSEIDGYKVADIDDFVFAGSSLESIVLPESLNILRGSNFYHCYSLKSVTVLNRNCKLQNLDLSINTVLCGYVGSTAYQYAIASKYRFGDIESGFEYRLEADNTMTVTGYFGKDSEITIPSVINDYNVRNIEFYFNNMCRLSDTVESVILQQGITKIGDYAFQECSSIKKIEIPDSVVELGDYAFIGCGKIADINIPDSVVKIGEQVFNTCVSLKSITIPASVTDIGFGILQGCFNLESIIVDENNKVYDSRENCNAIVKTASNEIIEACVNTTIPSSVTAIGNGAFGWRLVPETIIIPANITKIEAQAFACGPLKEVIILNSKCDINNFVYPPNSGGAQAYTFETDVIIHGYKNSTAQIYADTHGNKFVEILHQVQKKFADLKGFETYNDYVEYTSINNSFIAGTNPPKYTLFSPKTPITRAMFVAILYRMAGNPYDGANPYTSNPFSDISPSAYYYNAACWALDEGITNQKTFKPNNNVTREQTARFLYAYAESKGLLGDEAYKKVDLTGYPDYDAVHSWAVEPLQWANYNDMITGTQQGYINPQGATQRIHATRILYGFGKVCNIGNFE